MISIIIINYRQKNFLKECVRSIYDSFKSYPFEVIVVNNSSEEDLSELELLHPGLKIINNENKGFSQANNLGAKHSKGKYLFFLNADTIIENDFMESFIENFDKIEFGAVGLKLFNEDGSFQLSFWKENTFLNEMDNKRDEIYFREKNIDIISEKEKRYSEISEVEWVSGAAMIVRKDIYESIGGFDEKYFLFYEDADICKRLSEAGQKIYFFPFSNIVHFKGENVNKDFDSSSYYYSKESQLLYYKKHNNFFNNLLIRKYLFFKFLIKYLLTFKKINLRICLLTLGIRKK